MMDLQKHFKEHVKVEPPCLVLKCERTKIEKLVQRSRYEADLIINWCKQYQENKEVFVGN